MTQFRRQLQDFRLTTAEIVYHMPDHPALLQTYVWQDLDKAPQYPVLTRFLEFWQSRLDGKLHSVKVASRSVIAPPQIRLAGVLVTLH